VAQVFGTLSPFADAGLDGYLDQALAALRQAPELDDAVATAPPEPLEHRRAIARAVVAWVLVAADDDGRPAPDGGTRDALVLALTTALQGVWGARSLPGL
jgi:hypothetical protein